MGLSDSRPGRCAGYVFPPNVARFRSPPGRASQAPRLICPRALSPTTPEGPLAAFACCFTSGLVWLHPSRQTGHLRIPIEAESGLLVLRLTCSPPDSPVPLLEPTLVRLHAEQAIYMVNSFQFTRSARLILVTDHKGVGQAAAVPRCTAPRDPRRARQQAELGFFQQCRICRTAHGGRRRLTRRRLTRQHPAVRLLSSHHTNSRRHGAGSTLVQRLRHRRCEG